MTTDRPQTMPSLLVAYPFVRSFLDRWPSYEIRSWVLDSGAYSVLTSGIKIDLGRYVDDCLTLMASECRPEVIFGLDVIGDPEGTMRNVEEMKRQGVPAVPTFHYGCPFHYLEDMAKRYDRIAAGGLVARGSGGFGSKIHTAGRLKFLRQFFARVWPKWVHVFGCSDTTILASLPIASSDSTSWRYDLDRFGSSRVLGDYIVPKGRNSFYSFMRAEIESYAAFEREVRGRFMGVMLNAGIEPFQLRLACTERDAVWFTKNAPDIKRRQK